MTPWKDGWYYSEQLTSYMIMVTGRKINYYPHLVLDYPEDVPATFDGSITYGDFGPSNPEVQKLSGKIGANYNIEIKTFGGKMIIHGILSDDGTSMAFWGLSNRAETMVWQSKEDLKILAAQRDDIKSMTIPDFIKVQPENQGKIIWFTGPPGAGKSTTAQLMGRDAGFVYYEADMMMSFSNPFIDPNIENPSLAGFSQKPVKVNILYN